MNNDCRDNDRGRYKCNSCAFSRKESLACACPNIYQEPPKDSYYKSRRVELTEVEKDSIERVFD